MRTCTIAEGSAKVAQRARQRIVADANAVPHLFEQLALRHDAIPMGNEVNQEAERLGSDTDGRPTTTQLGSIVIELELTESNRLTAVDGVHGYGPRRRTPGEPWLRFAGRSVREDASGIFCEGSSARAVFSVGKISFGWWVERTN